MRTQHVGNLALQQHRGDSTGPSTKPGEHSASRALQVAGEQAGPEATRDREQIFGRDAGSLEFRGLGSKVIPGGI